MTNEKEQTNYAIISLTYKGTIYKSIPLELSEKNPYYMELVYQISESGTNGLSILKLPTSETKSEIFSREQLNESIIGLEILDNLPKTPKQVKKKIEQKSKLIKS